MSMNSESDISSHKDISPIDSVYVHDFFDGNVELIEKMAIVFISTYESDAENLDRLSGASDPAELKAWLHTLKSSSRYVGAVSLSILCEKQELLIDRNERPSVDALREISRILNSVLQLLNK